MSMSYSLRFVTKKYSATLLKMSLLNLTVKPKSLQNIDTHKFSEMSSASEKGFFGISAIFVKLYSFKSWNIIL